MKIYHSVDQLQNFFNPVATIGTFDGVHIGHQVILKNLVQYANSLQGTSIVITFWPHPRFILSPKTTLPAGYVLNTFEEKIFLFQKYGVQHLLLIPFTLEFAAWTAENFIQNIIVALHPSMIIIGYDHHFGKDRKGAYPLLIEAGKKYNFCIKQITAKACGSTIVNSTMIRKLLLDGRIDNIDQYLGRRYVMTGKVVKGKQIGSTLGFPTANLEIDRTKLIPTNGVYAVYIVYNNVRYKGILNIGKRPTIGDQKRTIEVHIIDFDTIIYDCFLQIEFVKYIREEKKFESLEALRKQLLQDKKVAIELLT